MVWLLPPAPPLPLVNYGQHYTGRLRERDNLLMGKKKEPNPRTARKPGPLYYEYIKYSLVCTSLAV